jgi:hypothetical protein
VVDLLLLSSSLDFKFDPYATNINPPNVTIPPTIVYNPGILSIPNKQPSV